MALCKMGHQHSSSGVFFQMDRSEDSTKHHFSSGASEKVLLAECCVQIWSPIQLTVDNGKQFDNNDFRRFCFHLGTKLCFTLVYHQESIGTLERANDIIFTGIKKNLLGMTRGKWAEELPRVIWSHNTTTSRATNFASFGLL
jgi:transposase InsO family protein